MMGTPRGDRPHRPGNVAPAPIFLTAGGTRVAVIEKLREWLGLFGDVAAGDGVRGRASGQSQSMIRSKNAPPEGP
jgi:hypothetical protein